MSLTQNMGRDLNMRKSRIASILNADVLDSSITGFPTFHLSELNLKDSLEFQLPSNVRLGHLAEKVVSKAIKASANYSVLFENVQLKENKITVGEIDFIIQNRLTNQLIHLELAYKFYLFDPNNSSTPLNNWIGPNRNDSLQNKLEKLKTKQFPLLKKSSTASAFNGIDLNLVSQKLCLLVSFFIPYGYKGSFSPIYEKAIKGYYSDFETFKRLDSFAKTYSIPSKKEWGIHPSENENWTDFAGVENHIRTSLDEKQSVLYWENNNGLYSTNFIVWWQGSD